MRKKAIIGYGGFAREVAIQMKFDDIRYFVDDQYWNDNEPSVYKLSEL